LQPVPDREQLAKQRKRLKVQANVDLEDLTAWLVEQGSQRMEAVEVPGEFSRRGGILDVFSPDAEAPYRLEFVGDDIESIRQFAAETQRSLGDLSAIEIASASSGQWSVASGQSSAAPRGHLGDYLPGRAWTVLVEPAVCSSSSCAFRACT
jgi:transcription-repair coupling factor (superfamily II helicase)